MKQPLKIYRDPVPQSRLGRRPKYPFANMEVGDCFYVPARELRSANVLASSARQWASRNGKDRKFVTRVVGDMLGIWRVR